ncbi:MAG: hypothetical protein IPN71_14775 [Fibrobacteres bacterium]|nr:hypothetical protein [Fibrobacterota bacterium]
MSAHHPLHASPLRRSLLAFAIGLAGASMAAEVRRDWNASVASLKNLSLEITGRSRVSITDSVAPLSGSVLDLQSDDVWLYLPNIRPARFDSMYRAQIKVRGAAAQPGSNVRFEQYLQGTMVISHGAAYKALRLYSQTNRRGDSLLLEPSTYYRTSQLGSMDNQARSLWLRQGYMATLAENEDGTGQSRVWVADLQDLLLDTLPAALAGKASFVRVFPWRWTAKKGWTNGVPAANALNAHWWYNWDNAAASTLDLEYVPMRHGKTWPDYANINSKTKVTHALGYNEPDRPDQANATVEEALAAWPEMLKSGLRLGSPSPSDASTGADWLFEFMRRADSLKYRVDFVPVHWYKGGQTASQFYGWLKWIHERTKRPVWITEWNNGANWTCCKPTYAEQATAIGQMIRMMDTARFVERYSIYEWVEDTRQMFLENPGKLTQAGEVYRADLSPMAYDADMANLVHGACLSSPISPNILLRGAWHQSPYATVQTGDTVSLSPWPWAGGTWSWTGPGGFRSTERTVVIPVTDAAKTGVYRAVHVNAAGCPSSLAFEVGLQGVSALAPRSAGGAWIRDGKLHLVGDADLQTTVTLAQTDGSILDRRRLAGSGTIDLRAYGQSGLLLVRAEATGNVLLSQALLLPRK